MGELQKIAIIGGGNMGGAIARGIVKSGITKPGHIAITRRNAAALKPWKEDGYAVTTNNNEAVDGADVVVFAVKPYQIADVISAVRPSLKKEVVAISIATGVSVDQLTAMLGQNVAAVRVMPNTAAEVGESLTAIVAGPYVSQPQLEVVERIFSALGLAIVVDEAQMPALTALASCGIAHALRYVRACQESAIEMGLKADVAAEVIAQTVKGAAQLILTNHSHPEVEIDKVCTPAGVTIAGINAMEHAGFTHAVMEGMMGSYKKIVK